jgi:hypothetical protein
LDQAQNEIGCEALLNGQVLIHWKEIQHQYYIYLGKRNTVECWVRLRIQKVWSIALDQWDHRNEVVHKQDMFIYQQAEADQLDGWIREAIWTCSGLVMEGDNYLFHNISVDAAFRWTLARKKDANGIWSKHENLIKRQMGDMFRFYTDQKMDSFSATTATLRMVGQMRSKLPRAVYFSKLTNVF